MRPQPGTTSLRAILYMDEIFGYFPPTANPPSKAPLLTLLKQARAFGVGVVLATQNPVDLDYKGLANAGTWFIGRLQTERDKAARCSTASKAPPPAPSRRFDRGAMEQTLAGLGNRVFLMNNVHEDAPVVFETRWAMSYLRGPLTREQIKTLMDPAKRRRDSRAAPATPARAVAAPARDAAQSHATSSRRTRPVLAPGRPAALRPRPLEPARTARRSSTNPRSSAAATSTSPTPRPASTSRKNSASSRRSTDNVVAVDWSQRRRRSTSTEADLDRDPQPTARRSRRSRRPRRRRRVTTRGRSSSPTRSTAGGQLQLFRSPALEADVSKPGESERDFRVRLAAGRARAARRSRSRSCGRSTPRSSRRSRSASAGPSRRSSASSEQASASKWNTAISRRQRRSSARSSAARRSAPATIGRATTAARGASRGYKESQDVARAGENRRGPPAAARRPPGPVRRRGQRARRG